MRSVESQTHFCVYPIQNEIGIGTSLVNGNVLDFINDSH